eukprot:CAMPEP_0201531240 /NCGR_PEP_ID=MMETSP0161_2-20130828/47034_1 /ASSEMBLY_ACC=CAM_ASM_000251 /TAXON_ID=180227 /ORGANISM="Neoparamoeba aestuarina, Strain SoJaBio B1-5/56/2" /LENGTH=129 /DNA_ID=CAMNT_0047934019 /DNA_START=135 /DNA_END=524 /DNA_ORIENTATION=+
MGALGLANNQFEGTISLDHLPPTMSALWLSRNNLHGALDFTRLPEAIEILSLSENGFLGSTDFSKLPNGFRKFDVSKTKLSGEIVIREGEVSIFRVDKSDVKLVLRADKSDPNGPREDDTPTLPTNSVL